MFRLAHLHVIAVVGVLLACGVDAQAQKRYPEGGRGKPNNQGRPEIPKQNIRAVGAIQGIKGNILHVVSEEGDQWLVKAPERPQNISVNGSAMPTWLQRGMWVRFFGTFDKKGAAQEPIKELFVFTPGQPGQERNAELYTVGVFPEGAASSGLKGVFADEGERKPVVEVVDYRIVGRLNGISNGIISVSAGRATVKAPLAEDARISASVADLRSIRIGDKVEINGWHLPNQKTHIFAERMTISPAQPLGTPIKMPEAEVEDKEK